MKVEIGDKYEIIGDFASRPKGTVYTVTGIETGGAIRALVQEPTWKEGRGNVILAPSTSGLVTYIAERKLRGCGIKCTCGKHDVPVDTTDFYAAHALYMGKQGLEMHDTNTSFVKDKPAAKGPRLLNEPFKVTIEEQW